MSVPFYPTRNASARRLAPDAVDTLLADDSVDFAPAASPGSAVPSASIDEPDRLLLRLQQQIDHLRNHQRRLDQWLGWSDLQDPSRH